MTKRLIKPLLGAAAIAVVAVMAMPSGADAACLWNGNSWRCQQMPTYMTYPSSAGYLAQRGSGFGVPYARYPGPALH